jgi:hypothetical protein
VSPSNVTPDRQGQASLEKEMRRLSDAAFRFTVGMLYSIAVVSTGLFVMFGLWAFADWLIH